MSAIRAVLFDFGGVLYRAPDPRNIARWLRLFGLRDLGPMVMLNASPRESGLVMDMFTGRLPEQQAWENLAQNWRIHPRLLRFLRRRGLSNQRLNRPLLNYLISLRPRCRTAILTNAGSEFRATFGSAYALEQYVDSLIISAEEGYAKPDPRLYRLAAERLGVRPEETIFVDDVIENVEGARSVGMTAFHYQAIAPIIQAIDALIM